MLLNVAITCVSHLTFQLLVSGLYRSFAAVVISYVLGGVGMTTQRMQTRHGERIWRDFTRLVRRLNNSFLTYESAAFNLLAPIQFLSKIFFTNL